MKEIKKFVGADCLIRTRTIRTIRTSEQVGMSEHEDSIAAVVCNLYGLTIAKANNSWNVHWESSERQEIKECNKKCFALDVLLNNHDGICNEPDIYFLACLTGLVKKFESGDKVKIDYLSSVDQYFIGS